MAFVKRSAASVLASAVFSVSLAQAQSSEPEAIAAAATSGDVAPSTSAAPAKQAAGAPSDGIAELPALEVVGKKKPAKKPKAAAAQAKAPTAGTATGGGTPADAFPEGATVVTTPSPFTEQQQAAYTSSGSTAYISGEAMQRFSGTSPSDVLRGVPGVTIGETRNGGGIDANIRGLQGQRRVSVTVDGAENTIDTYRGYAGTQQRSYLDPDLISDMTVTKGPTAALGAIAGTVEATTLKPEDILLEGKSYGVRVKGSIVSNSTTEPSKFASKPETEKNGLFDSDAANGSIAFAMREHYFDIVGAYAIRDQGNYFAGRKGHKNYRKFETLGAFTRELDSVGRFYKPGEEVLNSSVETNSLLLKTTVRPADGHSFEFGYRTFDSEMGEIMPSQIFRNTTGSIPQWRPGLYETDTFTAAYKWKPKDNGLIDFKLSGNYTNFDTDACNNPAGEGPRPFYVDANEGKDPGYRYLYGAKMETIRYGLNAANTSRLETGLGGFKFDYGGAFSLEDLHPDSGNFAITQEDIDAGRFLRSAVRSEVNAFSNAEWKPAKWLTFDGGVRYSYSKLRDRNRNPIIGDGPKHCTITYTEMQFGQSWPSAQLRWPADENGQCTAATDPRRDPNSWVNRFGQWMSLGSYLANFAVLNAANPTIGPVRQNANEAAIGFEEPIRREDEGVTYNASATVELAPGIITFAKYQEGMRLPGIFESSVGYFAATPGNELDPELAQNWEFGASFVGRSILAPKDQGMFRVSYFNNNVKNFISRFWEVDMDPEGGFQDQFAFENNDSFRIRGLEVQAAYDVGAIFADASITYNIDAKTCNRRRAEELRNSELAEYEPDLADTPNCVNGGFVGSFSNIQNPPEISANFTLGVRLLDEKLTLGGRALYASEPIAKLDKDYNGSFLSPQLNYDHATWIVDLFGEYKFNEAAILHFGVDNVQDLYYIDPLTVSYMPSPGRTFKAGMTAKF